MLSVVKLVTLGILLSTEHMYVAKEVIASLTVVFTVGVTGILQVPNVRFPLYVMPPELGSEKLPKALSIDVTTLFKDDTLGVIPDRLLTAGPSYVVTSEVLKF
tara:strand:- start:9065 stop:9373 length:309 start_codon:yes stop_codon:yes gene_type:complete